MDLGLHQPEVVAARGGGGGGGHEDLGGGGGVFARPWSCLFVSFHTAAWPNSRVLRLSHGSGPSHPPAGFDLMDRRRGSERALGTLSSMCVCDEVADRQAGGWSGSGGVKDLCPSQLFFFFLFFFRLYGKSSSPIITHSVYTRHLLRHLYSFSELFEVFSGPQLHSCQLHTPLPLLPQCHMQAAWKLFVVSQSFKQQHASIRES